MVVRLEGELDGKEVIFERKSETEWIYVSAPPDGGMYVIALTAYDEAGNIAYVTKFLITFDPVNLRMELMPYDYTSELEIYGHAASAVVSDYCCDAIKYDFCVSCKLSNYCAALLNEG
jgi:hypothetical protein